MRHFLRDRHRFEGMVTLRVTSVLMNPVAERKPFIRVIPVADKWE
jgi:hypothetical protein